MRYKKCISVLLIGVFILSSSLPIASAQSEKANFPILEWLAVGIFKNIYMMGVPWFVLRFQEPEAFTAEPSVIGIEYLNQTDIIIGSIDQSTGNYRSLMKYGINTNFIAHDFECSLEIPEYLPEDAFVAHFEPQLIIAGVEEGEVKTKLRITSYIPQDATLPKNIQLRVNITKFTSYGNLYLPPKGERGVLRGGYMTLMWMTMAALKIFGNPFGRLYSGKRLLEYTSFVDIVVKVDRFHLVDVIPQNGLEIGPDQLVNIPLEIRNRGSHVDCFNFRVSTDSELLVSPPPTITLGPNEVGYTSIGVASTRMLSDPGSARSINIEAYSIYEPNTIFNNTATVITRGVYVSEIVGYYFAIFLIVAFLFAVFSSYRKRRFLAKMCKKPDKPWTIPEEKKHLEKLKKKDRNEFEKVRLMMEDEYKSAMLWYENYCNAIKQKEKQRFFGLLKKIKEKKPLITTREKEREPKKAGKEEKRKLKESIGNKLTSFFKKLERKEPKRPKKEKKPVKKEEKVEENQRIKEKVLLKILREQEKQKRKLKI